MSKQIEFIVKLRDASQMIVDAANQYIEALTQNEPKIESTEVNETTFAALKFEAQQGLKLGSYEIAYKQANIESKWQYAYSLLQNSNSTIKNRYHCPDYQYSYWLYGADKIYRQKLKPKQ